MSTPIYLDHNASTPIDPQVLETVIRVSRDIYANASSVEHGPGAAAASIVQAARSQVAGLINCRETEIIFTSGSTEANNLAILGSYAELERCDRTHFITTCVEHPSVLACFDWLEARGSRVTRLGVNQEGLISLDELFDVLSDQTGLVSIMAANNETGVLQPIMEAGQLCENVGAWFHTDYSQAAAYIPLNLHEAPIHMASFSAHKAYGPKGVGALYRSLRKPRIRLTPVLLGGGQEAGLRAGTLNTPGIAGLGHSFALISDQLENDCLRIRELRDRLQLELQQTVSLQVNGSVEARLPNSMSLTFDGVVPQALMHRLRGEICFSASSACATERIETSHVLLAMFGDTPRAKNAFRLGLGRQTSASDVTKVIEKFAEAAPDLLRIRSQPN